MLFPVASGDIIQADAINTLNSAAAWFSEDTGSANAFQLTFDGSSPNFNDITSLTNGQIVSFVAASANSGPCTLQINSLGDAGLTKQGGNPLAAGDIVAGQLVTAIFNADQLRFELLGSAGGASNLIPAGDTYSWQIDSGPSYLTLGAGLLGVPASGAWALGRVGYQKTYIATGDPYTGEDNGVIGIAMPDTGYLYCYHGLGIGIDGESATVGLGNWSIGFTGSSGMIRGAGGDVISLVPSGSGYYWGMAYGPYVMTLDVDSETLTVSNLAFSGYSIDATIGSSAPSLAALGIGGVGQPASAAQACWVPITIDGVSTYLPGFR